MVGAVVTDDVNVVANTSLKCKDGDKVIPDVRVDETVSVKPI